MFASPGERQVLSALLIRPILINLQYRHFHLYEMDKLVLHFDR